MKIYDNGTSIRNQLHAQDTANAIITIIKSEVKNEIFNICGGFKQSNFDTVKKLLILNDINIEDINKHID